METKIPPLCQFSVCLIRKRTRGHLFNNGSNFLVLFMMANCHSRLGHLLKVQSSPNAVKEAPEWHKAHILMLFLFMFVVCIYYEFKRLISWK